MFSELHINKFFGDTFVRFVSDRSLATQGVAYFSGCGNLRFRYVWKYYIIAQSICAFDFKISGSDRKFTVLDLDFILIRNRKIIGKYRTFSDLIYSSEPIFFTPPCFIWTPKRESIILVNMKCIWSEELNHFGLITGLFKQSSQSLSLISKYSTSVTHFPLFELIFLFINAQAD